MNKREVAAHALKSLENFKGSSGSDPTKRKPQTYMGVVGAELTTSLEGRIEELQARLADGESVLRLDPRQIRPTKYANRDARSLAASDPDFAELMQSIQTLGANEQPILVRPAEPGTEYQFEICFGHRRHAACLNLGVPVRATVRTFSDFELVKAMHRENTMRKDLSAYERALQFKGTLAAGLVADQKELAAAYETSETTVSHHLALLELPREIFEAFRDPRVIPLRWLAEFNRILKDRRDSVIQIAMEIAGRDETLPPDQVRALLLTKPPRPVGVEVQGRYEQTIRLHDKKTVGAKLRRDGRSLKIDLGKSIASPELLRKITEAFEATLKSCIDEAQRASENHGK